MVRVFLTLAVAFLLTLASGPSTFAISPVVPAGSAPFHASVPRSAPVTPVVSDAVNPFLAYSAEPAPMGIADFGVGPSGSYQYNTTAFMGNIDIYSLVTRNATGDPWMSFQLNVVLVFSNDNIEYSYWIQDVAQIDTSANQVWFLDNIWNFTSSAPGILPTAVTGNGVVDVFGGTGFYYDAPSGGPGNGVTLTYPATVSFLVTTSLNSLHQPVVNFAYNDGSGEVTYDTVTFIKANHVTSFAGFLVDGNNYNPLGLFYNAELIMGGPGAGFSTNIVQSDVAMGLSYYNGHNYEAARNTYNFGSNTAEAVGNADSKWYYYTATGELIADIFGGAGSLSTLYDETKTSTIDITTTVTSGELRVSNATDVAATPHKSAFTGGRVTVTIYPGVYLLQLYASGALYDSATTTLTPGQTVILSTPLGDIRITMSYSVAGGGIGFSAPMLRYTHGGVPQTAMLTTTATAYYMDAGTTWSVDHNFTTATERWATLQQTTGTASSYQTIQITYQHQLRFGFTFSVIGGGVGYSPPVVRFVQFGTDATATANSTVWADASSTFVYPDSLTGSSAAERWEAESPSGFVGGSGTVVEVYYHQYGLHVSYTTTGLPSGPPELTGTQFGMPFSASVPVRGSDTVYYLDSGTSWHLPTLLPGSTTHERWAATQPTDGTVSQSQSLLFLYGHQFAVVASSTPFQGGSVTTPGGWTDAGASIQLVQNPAPGWKFEGWSGSGPGSYSGQSNSTSVQVNAPINETATYYPGLRITAGSDGSVSYSFGTQTGSVPPGSTVTIYAPPGTQVSLESVPSSFLYAFSGWSPATAGTTSPTQVSLDSPVAITATFSLSVIVVGGIATVAALILAAAVLVLRRRGRSAS